MRILPTFSHTCHVCGSTFTVHNRVSDPGVRTRVTQEPSACPFCDARIEARREISVGIAKGLLLASTGLKSMQKEYGTPERYLTESALTEGDLDELMRLVRGMDYDAWEALNQRLLPHDPGLKTEARQVGKLREAALRGDLLEKLGEAAERVRAALRARHRRHLAVFEARRREG